MSGAADGSIDVGSDSPKTGMSRWRKTLGKKRNCKVEGRAGVRSEERMHLRAT